MKPENTPLKGELEISQAALEAVPAPKGVRGTLVCITMPEFTCRCPITGYPDFAQVLVTYMPDEFLVELKSLKLWLNSFRDSYMFHEAACAEIFEALHSLLRPLYLEVCMDYSRRGNVKTRVYKRSGPPPDEYSDLSAAPLQEL